MSKNIPHVRYPSKKADKTRAISVLRSLPIPGANGNPNRPMTDKQKLLAKAMAMPGMTEAAAARMAGYSASGADSLLSKMKKDPAFKKLMEVEHKAYTEASAMTRKRVIDGFLRAVELSEVKTDSIAMTAAWREIGRLCGFYAPKVIQHKVSLEGEAFKDKLRQMTDDELMRLGSGEAVLDGEFEIVEDGNQPDSIRDELTGVR